MQEHHLEVEDSTAEIFSAVGRAAELWGADWEPQGMPGGAGFSGSLHLPVTAGLRHGAVTGELTVEPRTGGAALRFVSRQSIYYLQTSAVVILVIAAGGGILASLWPFFPNNEAIQQVAPLGAVLALTGWLLVVARLRSRGPEDFLLLVESMVGAEEGQERPEEPEESGSFEPR